MNSMTGYGRAAAEDDGHRIEVSLRSVNHRFLDVAVRLKEPYRVSETKLRRLLKERFARGRIDVVVEITPRGEAPLKLFVRRRAMLSLLEDLADLEPQLGDLERPSVGDLLGLPEVIEVRGAGDTWKEDDESLLLRCVEQAAAQLEAARRREGEALQATLRTTLSELHELLVELAERRERIEGGVLERMRARLRQLVGGTGVDEGRLMQEAAHLVERSEVAEELDRLDAHCRAFADALEESGATIPTAHKCDSN